MTLRSVPNEDTPAGRVPPHNFEAEESLLGAMMLSRDALSVAVESVTVEDFYRPSNGHAFAAALSLFQRSEPVDAITVAEEMRRNGTLEPSGGISRLMVFTNDMPAISSAGRYATIVHEHARLRRLIAAGYEVADLGYSLPEDVTATIDHAERLIFELAQAHSSDSARPLSELLTAALEHLDEMARFKGGVTGIPTGYSDLDESLHGLQDSNLVVIGARPSMGKTAFGLGLAVHAAVRSMTPVLFFSLEMNRLELAQRVISSEARVDASRLRSAQLNENDYARISTSIASITAAPLYIDDNPLVTVMDIRAKARRMKSSEQGLGLVVVDYLQLMTNRSTNGKSAENRQVEISQISRDLKILARELSIPVVACSQLSRGLESRADKRPMLSDLRESGAIEQDADIVLFLYRDEVYNLDSSERGTAEVIISKHRNGPTGVVRLSFVSNCARFGNLARF